MTDRPASFGGFRVEFHRSVASTQVAMRDRLESGVEVDGLVIRAAEQTAGRGRRGSPWLSAPGGSYQTAAFRVGERLTGGEAAPRDGLQASFLPLALAIGIATGLEDAGARVRLKWPNDLMLGERKLGGLLVERTAGHVLVGVGLNVDNPVPETFAALRGWDAAAVGDLVLEGLAAGRALMARPPAEALSAYGRLDWLAGRLTAVDVGGSVLAGVAAGVDEAGCLKLRPSGGAEGLLRACRGHVLSAAR